MAVTKVKTFPTLAVTSPFKVGTTVREAQYLLINNRWNIPFYHDKIDGEYGPLTGAAAYLAKYTLGYAEDQLNNNFGATLRSYLVPEDHPAFKKLPIDKVIRQKSRAKQQHTLQANSIERARKFVGYRETPNNRTIFGKWFGADGNPWCAYFVSYNITKSGGHFMQGYVPTILELARESKNKTWVTKNPQKGFLALFDWQRDGVYDHIGFFDAWINRQEGTFKTVEGNTLPPGGTGNQSNGGGVYARTRSTKDANVVFVGYSK